MGWEIGLHYSAFTKGNAIRQEYLVGTTFRNRTVFGVGKVVVYERIQFPRKNGSKAD